MARAGEFPREALAGVLCRLRPEYEAARPGVIARAQRLLARGDARGHLPAVYGLVTPAEVDPKVAERAAKAIARLTDVAKGERANAANVYHALLCHPAAFDAFLAHGHAQIGKSHADTASWFDVAEVALGRLRSVEPPLPILAERTLLLAAHRANLDRVRGDLRAAAVAWAELARDWRRPRVLNLAVHAGLWRVEASLRTARREFSLAESRLAQAEFAYQALRLPIRVAETLLKMSGCAEYQGDSARAVELSCEAAHLVQPAVEPRLYGSAQLNQANALVGLGRAREASRVLGLARPFLRYGGDESHRMRLAWVEGKIARALGVPEEAEAKLRAAVDACDAQGLHYDAALARLDLADLFLAQGRTGEVKELAKALVQAFRAREVDREALAAVRLFAEAAQEERLRPVLLDALRAYLRLAQLDPSYPFTPPTAAQSWFAPRPPEGRR